MSLLEFLPKIFKSDVAFKGAVTLGTTQLSSSAAELNTLAASGVTNADLVKLHALSNSAAQITEATDPLTGDSLQRKGVYRATYDFSVDGGAVSAIVPSAAPTLPAKAVVTRAWAHVVTAFTGNSGATVAVKIEGAGDLLAAATLASAGWNTTGFKELIPDGTAAKFVQTSTARQVTLTVGTATLTAGKAVLELEYVITA